MVNSYNSTTNNYKEILAAEKKGVLWPTGQCLSTGCSAEIQLNREWLKKNNDKSIQL